MNLALPRQMMQGTDRNVKRRGNVIPMLKMKSKILPYLAAFLAVAVVTSTTVAQDANTDAEEAGPTSPPRQMLFNIFAPIMKDLGAWNLQKPTVVSGPVEMKMANNQKPGKQWRIRLGQSEFKVTIEDASKLKLATALTYVERIPVVYRRALEVVSEEKKAGLAFYTTLDGASAHGGQSYLNMIPLKPAHAASVIVHEAGHILEQRARDTDTELLNKWAQAAKADNIDVSNYGNQVNHEDVAEFARLYAFCIDHSMGRGRLKDLQKLSPARFALWERMLELSGAKPQPQLTKLFGPLAKTMGKNNKGKAKVTAGPTAAEMPIENKKETTPGKTWEIALGESKFKVTIDDKAETTLAQILEKVQKMPPAYLRCLEVVSEEGKLGLSVYATLRGRAAGQGTQHFLRILPRAPVWVLIHEAGHVLEQRARDTDEDILWKNIVAKTHDNISVSDYGNGPIHEDQAEFARIYAICLGNTPADQARLRAASPYRYALWEQILVLSKAIDAKVAAPAPVVDFDAELAKIRERDKQMRPIIETLDENIITAQAAMKRE